MEINVRGILCDMDGSLIDSNPIVEAMWQRFCDEHGVDLAELLEFSHGRLANATLERFMPGATLEQRDQQQARLLEWESQANDEVQTVPGARDFIIALDELGVPWALVTSAVRSLAVTRFEVTKIPWPAVEVTAERVATGKPDPAGYLLAAQELGVRATDCVVFEDAEPGIRAGLAAGATVVVVGDFESKVTQGLPRISDFAGVKIVAGSQPDWFSLSV